MAIVPLEGLQEVLERFDTSLRNNETPIFLDSDRDRFVKAIEEIRNLRAVLQPLVEAYEAEQIIEVKPEHKKPLLKAMKAARVVLGKARGGF